ncbi:MAG: hypothetical protein ACRDYV_15855 [Acidimicrobiia bacterium]
MKFRAAFCSAVVLGALVVGLPAHGDEQPPPDKEQNPVAELLCSLGDPNCVQEEPAPSS